FKAQFAEYVATRRPAATIRTLSDMVDANRRRSVRQPAVEVAAEKGRVSDRAYQEAVARLRQNAHQQGVDRALAMNHLETIVKPSIGPGWKFAEAEQANILLPKTIFLTSGAGYPAVTVPIGTVHGLPVGIIFAGPAWSEPTLLRCAHAYEMATH